MAIFVGNFGENWTNFLFQYLVTLLLIAIPCSNKMGRRRFPKYKAIKKQESTLPTLAG